MLAQVDHTQHIHIFGVNSGCGAMDPRCAYGPDTIHATNLQNRLQQIGINTRWNELDQDFKNNPPLKTIASLCDLLANNIKEQVKSNKKFIVIGGDHSSAIGSWSGVAAAQSPSGLIWIDAHLDSHTPETSHSQAIHGMPLAILLGYGDQQLTDIAGIKPKVNPEHVCIIGARSYEPEELALLTNLGVKIYFMSDIKQLGLKQVFANALDIVTRNNKGFGISIDMDAIDPADAPGVGTPEANGIVGRELVKCLCGIAHHKRFIGLEIAEFNPMVDKNNKTLNLCCDLIETVFKEERHE